MAAEIEDFRIFVDTNVVTFYPFLENPDAFLPEGRQGPARFVIVLPVVRELERIKDEHFSEGQRKRAKALLDRLEEADRTNGVRLTDQSQLVFRLEEPTEAHVLDSGISLVSPDDRFIACVWWIQKYTSLGHAVLSADVGVRVRARHLPKPCHVYAPPEDLRLKRDEDFNLPQLMKATIKELARELAEAMRQHPA
jgi:predicted ribonuclease YlaK